MHSPFPHFETVIKLFPPLISLTPFFGLITVAIPVAESSLSSVGSQQISQSESCPLSEWACSRSGFGDHLEAYFEFRNDSVAPLVDEILRILNSFPGLTDIKRARTLESWTFLPQNVAIVHGISFSDGPGHGGHLFVEAFSTLENLRIPPTQIWEIFWDQPLVSQNRTILHSLTLTHSDHKGALQNSAQFWLSTSGSKQVIRFFVTIWLGWWHWLVWFRVLVAIRSESQVLHSPQL